MEWAFFIALVVKILEVHIHAFLLAGSINFLYMNGNYINIQKSVYTEKIVHKTNMHMHTYMIFTVLFLSDAGS